MWCYQKPGFEALLLSELQKQQQNSKFCDTLLKADGISVPAHSCILAAVSSEFSASLSSSPLPAGQKRLLEFGELDACTLLHLVKLLYSGQMVGEGEKEKQEAISAAAKLGIHGLVEVSPADSLHSKQQDECLYIEVGVQTESQMFEEHRVRLGGWRREVQDGATVLWRETLPSEGTDMWTQTENLQMNCTSTSSLPVSYETIDMNALQSLGESESLQFPYVPISVACPSEGHHSNGQSSFSAATPSMITHYAPVQSNAFPIDSQVTSYTAGASQWRPEVSRTPVMEQWPEEEFEQFEGNISGFINYFLNPDKENCSNPRPGNRGRGAGARGSRQVGTRGRPRGRRGRLTQTVDVQDVGVSKLAKMYHQRWGTYRNRTGQGGGAVGRMLSVKTREFVKSGRSSQRGRGRGKEWNLLMKAEDGTKRPGVKSRKDGKRQQVQVSPFERPENVTKAPPARSSVEQPQQIDHLLEEVMRELDILPNSDKNTISRATACPVQKQRRKASDASQNRGSEAPVLQQPQEGELTDILDQFLQSFEQLESEAAQNATQSIENHTTVNEYRKNNRQRPVHSPKRQPACPALTRAAPRTSTQSETSESDTMTSVCRQQHENLSGKSSPAVRRRRRKDYPFSLEKPKTKCKKATLSEDVKQQVRKQLQQIPVVKLIRRVTVPENMKVLELHENPASKAKKCPSKSLLWATKTYPIRSRLKETQIMNADPFLENPLSDHGHRGKLSKNIPRPLSSQGSLFRADQRMETNRRDDGAVHKESKTRDGKRRRDSTEQESEVEKKRVCPERESSSSDAEEVIDIETISPSNTNNTVLRMNSDAMNGDAAESDASDADAESSDIIDVVN